jgi:transposase-like protein
MLRAMKKETAASATALRRVLKRLHFPLEVMLTCVRWWVAYPLNLRHREEMTVERGVAVDHCARVLLASSELMHMIRKGQMHNTRSQNPSPAQQFHALAA